MAVHDLSFHPISGINSIQSSLPSLFGSVAPHGGEAKSDLQKPKIPRKQEAFRERRHLHFCNLLDLSCERRMSLHVTYCVVPLIPGMMSVGVKFARYDH